MKAKVFQYAGCSTCKKALNFLKAKDLDFESIPIVEQPPTVGELKQMLGLLRAEGKPLAKLFNTSGVLYREMKIADKLKSGLSDEDAIKLLAKNGKLIKRPFVLLGTMGTVGFDESRWKELFKVR